MGLNGIGLNKNNLITSMLEDVCILIKIVIYFTIKFKLRNISQ